MVVELYTTPDVTWFKKIPVSREYPRHWITVIDLEIHLSNGYVIKTPKGTIWDGASIPKIVWWMFKPIDEASIADFLHDFLWVNKEEQLKLFDFNIYKTRLFADNERNNWRKRLTKNWYRKNIKNPTTHFIIRKLGGVFYSKQINIPK